MAPPKIKIGKSQNQYTVKNNSIRSFLQLFCENETKKLLQKMFNKEHHERNGYNGGEI